MVRFGLIVTTALVLAACGTSHSVKSVGASRWDGDYRFKWTSSSSPAVRRGFVAPEKVQIRPLTSSDGVPGAKAHSNGPQWAISFVGEAGKPLPLTPFTANDYRDMGWTDMRAAGQMDCLESGAFMFICRTLPGATVHFGRRSDEQLTTKTGLFGVALHQGGFELTPLD